MGDRWVERCRWSKSWGRGEQGSHHQICWRTLHSLHFVLFVFLFHCVWVLPDERKEGARSRVSVSKGASWGCSSIWWGCLLGTFPWSFSGNIQLVGDPGVRPEHAGFSSHLVWEHLGIPPEELENVAEERDVCNTLLGLLKLQPSPG